MEDLIKDLSEEYFTAYQFYTPQEQLFQLQKYAARLIYSYSKLELIDEVNLTINDLYMIEQDIADIINIINQVICNEKLSIKRIEALAKYRMVKHYEEKLKNIFKK